MHTTKIHDIKSKTKKYSLQLVTFTIIIILYYQNTRNCCTTIKCNSSIQARLAVSRFNVRVLPHQDNLNEIRDITIKLYIKKLTKDLDGEEDNIYHKIQLGQATVHVCLSSPEISQNCTGLHLT